MTASTVKVKEKYIQISMVIITVMMTILRFLLNEKGRVTPDSIRFMRFANVFPVIDNTTTPLGYPLMIKLFTFFGFDEFWGSKAVGICALVFVILFAWRKQFFLKETVLVCSLFSFVSVFAATLSEVLILPFIFLYFYTVHKVITGKTVPQKAFFYLSFILILLFNIRYSALFIIGASALFGLISYRKKFGPPFLWAAVAACVYIISYKFLFIDYFNEQYISKFLETDLKTTALLLTEFFQGLATSFNPFVHIANPAGGIINLGIYGIGTANIALIIFLSVKNRLSETERFMMICGIVGVLCSYFIQYVYSVDALDYRLLAPFTFPVWLVYFKQLFQKYGTKVYSVGALSLLSGFVFTWLSKGSYLENRNEMSRYLKSEKLDQVPLKFYIEREDDLSEIQVAELISTVNPRLNLTFKPQDTLQKTTLTHYKVLQKIKIDRNKYQ